MNNLTTRKIVLGMLMTLVLAFSVQGICEALKLAATSDTTQVKQPDDDPFEIKFTVTLVGDTANPVNKGTRKGTTTAINKTDVTATATLAGFEQNLNNLSITPDNAGDYYYYDRTTVDTASDKGTTTRNWVSKDNAYYYNEEAIGIILANPSSPDPIIVAGTPYRIPSPLGEVTLFEGGTILSKTSGSTTLTLEWQHATAGTYTITIFDKTAGTDKPSSDDLDEGITSVDTEDLVFTLHVTREEPIGTDTITAQSPNDSTDTTGLSFVKRETSKKVEAIKGHFIVPDDRNLQIRYRVVRGDGMLYAAKTATTGTFIEPTTDLTVHQDVKVFLSTDQTTNEVVASIAGQDRSKSATIVYEYTGPDPREPTGSSGPGTTIITQTARLTISVTGTGATRSVTVNALNAAGNNLQIAIPVMLSGTALTFSRTLTTGTALTIPLPTIPRLYTLVATDPSGTFALGTINITVAAAPTPGNLSITAIGAVTNLQQTVEVSATSTAGTGVQGVSVTLSGAFFTTQTVTTLAGGTVRTIVTIPSATGQHILNVSAPRYPATSITLSAAGVVTPPVTPPPATPPPATTVGEPSSIQISGPAARSGTVNEQLDTPLLVRVLDDSGTGVANARVIFRVISGRGKLSDRGNGRAVGVQTDSSGYARANFTPTDGGAITVRASTNDISTTVEFTITTGAAPTTTRGPGTGVPSGTSVSPVVHVGAASRPPMLWVDGGAIYALVGASPQRFAASVDNALNIVIGGGKVYWTEKTGESGGTINSANLNGSDVTELTSIKAVPMGIAVDTAGSKLYWTNSRGRIQSADLDGSGITNVMQNLPSPMDLALAGGNAYWTQGNGSVRFVNLRGQKVVRNVSTGTDTPGSLVIGGGKVYWTEMTGESGGTVNSANLNGTGATQLASILAAPMGIAVDGSRSKLYWTNARGRIQSANLDGSGIKNVVSGLGSPGDMVLSNSISAPAATTTTRTTTTASNKYDVNGDGSVNNADSDAITVAIAAGATDAKYDVNGDGTVNVFDLVEIIANRDPGAAGAPTLFGMKMSAAQIDSLQEQIDLLIATNDRSPAALRTLIYLQQLLVTARPEKTLLLANYPNPFNPETWIPYELATDTDVKVTIYNTQGVVIRSLQLGHQSAGYYMGRDRAAYWDGRNALGEQVASGLYFYQLETDAMSLMRKMVILK